MEEEKEEGDDAGRRKGTRTQGERQRGGGNKVDVGRNRQEIRAGQQQRSRDGNRAQPEQANPEKPVSLDRAGRSRRSR